MKKNYLFVFTALALLLSPSFVFAHERQVFDIGGTQYLFTVGSLAEPAFVDQKSGVDLRVKLADPKNPGDGASLKAKPFAGLESTLKVEVSAGGSKRVFDLSPAYGDPGAYTAAFYPTVATTYAYRFFGTVASTSVDLTFTCNPAGHPKSADDTSVTELGAGVKRTLKAGSFGCFQAPSSVQFPEKTGTLVWLQNYTGRIHLMAGIALALAAISLVWTIRTSKKVSSGAN